VQHQDFPATDLIHLADNNLADQVLVPLDRIVFLDIPDSLRERLTSRHDGTTTKVLELDLFCDFVPYLKVLVNLLGFRLFYFRHRILNRPVFHNLTDVDDLHVTVVRVQDDLE